MTVELVRPDVSNLVLCAYDRVLHPELFERHCGLLVGNSKMKLDIRLNASGHVLILQTDSDWITEVIADQGDGLPEHRRIVESRLRGSRNESITFDSGLHYDLSCQVELLHMDIFLRMDEELELDRQRADLSARLPAINRFLPGPLSLIRTEVTRNSILVYAFHTFPEHSAIVKTQSLFDRDPR